MKRLISICLLVSMVFCSFVYAAGSGDRYQEGYNDGYNDIYANLQQQMPSAANVLSAKRGFMTQPIRSERFTYSGASNNANLQCIHAGGGKWYYLQWCNHKSWDKLTNLWVQTVSGGNYTTGSSIAIIAAYKEWNGKDYIFRNDTFVKPLFYLARG